MIEADANIKTQAEAEPPCCVLIPGTRINPLERPNRWKTKWSALRGEIGRKIPGAVFVEFSWTRRLSQRDRYSAAMRLARDLTALRQTHQNIVVIAHSHGGNVAIQAIQLANLVTIRLITLGTPFMRITDESFATRLKWLIAVTVVVLFLSSGVLIYLPYFGSNTLPVVQLVLWLTIYLGVVLSSHRWMPYVQRWLEKYMTARRRAYNRVELNGPIEMLVVYHEIYDEAEMSLRLLRARTLGAARGFLRRQRQIGGMELSPRSMRYPAICFGCAAALTGLLKLLPLGFASPNMLFIQVISALALAFATLTMLWVIWIILPGGLRSVFALRQLMISASLWSLYGRVNAGNPLDLLVLGVTTHAKPRTQPEWQHMVKFLPLGHGSNSFFGRLFQRLFRGPFHSIYRESTAFKELGDWVAQGRVG